MTLRSRLLHTIAVDVAVVGLQKRPISAKVLRVGGREFLGPGISIAGVPDGRDCNRCLRLD